MCSDYLSPFILDLQWSLSFYFHSVHRNMEANATPHDHEDQDEYVLLDLDGVSGLVDVPPNAKYVLSVSSQSAAYNILHVFH